MLEREAIVAAKILSRLEQLPLISVRHVLNKHITTMYTCTRYTPHTHTRTRTHVIPTRHILRVLQKHLFFLQKQVFWRCSIGVPSVWMFPRFGCSLGLDVPSGPTSAGALIGGP